jgi:hypothetical protein
LQVGLASIPPLSLLLMLHSCRILPKRYVLAKKLVASDWLELIGTDIVRKDPVIVELAAKYNSTPTQVCLTRSIFPGLFKEGARLSLPGTFLGMS